VDLSGLVLALDPNDPVRAFTVLASDAPPERVAGPLVEVPALSDRPAAGGPIWAERGLYRALERRAETNPIRVPLVPFYDAGNRHPETYADKGRSPSILAGREVTYQVWLPYTWAQPLG
jgi:hypothetical protein